MDGFRACLRGEEGPEGGELVCSPLAGREQREWRMQPLERLRERGPRLAVVPAPRAAHGLSSAPRRKVRGVGSALGVWPWVVTSGRRR